MATHHIRTRLLALVLAFGLCLGLGSALAQNEPQADEEQGFFSALWHYVERLPLAMEDEEQGALILPAWQGSLGGPRTATAEEGEPMDEEQGFFGKFKTVVKTVINRTASKIKDWTE